MSSSGSRGPFDNIEISDVTITASTNIASIKLSLENFQHTFDADKSKERKLTLSRVSLTSDSTPLLVKVRLDSVIPFNKKKVEFEIKPDDILSNAVDIPPDKREYRTTVKGIEVIIQFIVPQTLMEPPLTNSAWSTTDEIFEMCPRFRVLVIGRTGAGKTSLIKNMFGVTEAHISHSEVGECDINQELFSIDENKRFVLHDSKGFEPGDADNFKTVTKFLNDRKDNPDIKDQVHAVWLCFSIPVAGDRLFETGSENFLQMLSEGKLGRMPIIAIFTKYDKLVDEIFYNGNLERSDAETQAEAKLVELCVKPFKEQIKGRTEIPDIAVSTTDGYQSTLHRLTEMTTHRVGQYLTADVAVVSAVAQQVNPTLKLDAVIAVGKKRYWRTLASTFTYPGNHLEKVLQHIHQDIVRIWNLQDRHGLLDSSQFKQLVVASIVSKQDILTVKNMVPAVSMLAALAGIVAALAGPVAPIVLPIAAVLVAGHWTILLLRQAGAMLQQATIYIVALTIIMQNIFAITTSTKNVVSRRLITLALKTFLESPQHEFIPSVKECMSSPIHFTRDAVLQKITELIKSDSNHLSPQDMAKIKDILKDFDVNENDTWPHTGAL